MSMVFENFWREIKASRNLEVAFGVIEERFDRILGAVYKNCRGWDYPLQKYFLKALISFNFCYVCIALNATV